MPEFIEIIKVPLYTGDCMLNTYFMALSGVEDIERFNLIKGALHENLRADFIINSADNLKFSKKLTHHYQTLPAEDIERELTPTQLRSFVQNGCQHLSSLNDQQIHTRWRLMEFSQRYKEQGLKIKGIRNYL